jgi:hypothetical protein
VRCGTAPMRWWDLLARANKVQGTVSKGGTATLASVACNATDLSKWPRASVGVRSC